SAISATFWSHPMSSVRRLTFEALEARQVMSLIIGGADSDDFVLSNAKGGPKAPISGPPIDLATVVAHEIGHTLGLDHSNSPDCGTANQPIMCAYYIGPAFRLAPEDVTKIRTLYPDDSIVF